jgi:hypothetical protein
LKIDLRWPVVLVALVLTVSCIYGVNYWRQQRFIDEPLRESLLNVNGVEDVEINNKKQKNSVTEVSILLQEVEDLSKTYKEIEGILDLAYAQDSYRIVILDKRDSYLESLYNRIHYALMEGERRGNYNNMNKEVSLLLDNETSLKNYHLRVDQKRIYLQLSSEEKYLYEIIPINTSTEVS